MKLDKNTLTKEQKALEKEFGVEFYITKEKKLGMKTSTKYETYLIEQEFENTIKQITAGYTQAEIDTWATKIEEAQKVIAGGTSEILSSLLLEGENLLDFAKKILQKAKEYSEIYYKAEKTKREKLKNIT